MQFEYDERKSESNRNKHGIDFAEARSLWDDPDLMEFRIENCSEDLWGVMSHHNGSCWVAICATHGRNTRIISARRATVEEAAFYDRTCNDR